jgi:hypothetical protein
LVRHTAIHRSARSFFRLEAFSVIAAAKQMMPPSTAAGIEADIRRGTLRERQHPDAHRRGDWACARFSGIWLAKHSVLRVAQKLSIAAAASRHSIEVIEQEGETRQYRLFTDREGAAPAEAPDVCK